MHLVEDDFAPLIRRDAQPVWSDPGIGFERRSVSPPAQTLAAEVLECALEPGTRITYDEPPRRGLEHHLVLIEGRLDITVDGRSHALQSGRLPALPAVRREHIRNARGRGAPNTSWSSCECR